MSSENIFLVIGVILAAFTLKRFVPDPVRYSSMQPRYGPYDVNESTLNNAQASEIHTFTFNENSVRQMRSLIRALLQKGER